MMSGESSSSDADRAASIFHAALALGSADRATYLASACGNNLELRRQLEALLRAHGGENFLAEEPGTGAEAASGAAAPTVFVPVTEGPGSVVGPYKLLEQVGEGGFGVVYVAEQREPVRRRVALKVIKLGMDTKQVVARFEAERQALALMDHPNIAKVLDAGTTEAGRPYFVMELVKGIPITKYRDKERLDIRARLDLFIKVCGAIQHAHQKGVIHRDIKPSNILVTLHDGVPVPKVIDFGIAKATQQELTEKTIYTQLQQFIGTPAYMSPEQAEMSGLDIDTRSDIYSLGVLLYELLTGATPFDAKELLESGLDEMRKIIREREPVKPSTRLTRLQASKAAVATPKSSIDRDLDWIVMKCLEKDRSRRYETANGLAMDIRRHLADEPVIARPPSPVYRFRKLVRRNQIAFAAAAVVAAALVLGFGIATYSLLQERQAHRRAVAAERDQAWQRERAEMNARRASESELRSRRLLYAADMNLAHQAARANNLGRARRVLDRHRPQPGQEDLRGWEWRYLWQQCRGTELAVLGQHSTRANSVSFSADGRRLAAGYWDGRVEFWDVPARRLGKVLHQESGVQAQVAFSPRTNVLVATADPGVIKWHDPAGGETVVGEGFGRIRDLAFSNDGEWFVALGFVEPDGESSTPAALVFDFARKQLLSTHLVPPGVGIHFNNVRLSPDKKRLYVSHGAFREPKVRCLRVSNGEILWETGASADNGFSSMDVSPDGRVLVTGSGYVDPRVTVWDAESGELLARLEGHSGWLGQLAFSPDGRILASASADQTIRLWDTRTWRESAVLRGHGDEVHAVRFSPDGELLASGSKDGVVMLWEVRNQRPAGGRQVLPHILTMRPLPGGDAVLALGSNNTWLTIDLDTLHETRLPLEAAAADVSLIPPNYLGVQFASNRFRLYEVLPARLQPLGEVPMERAYKSRFAYSAKGRLLAWSVSSHMIRMTGLGETAIRKEWTSDSGSLRPVRFGADGRLLLAVDASDSVYVWNAGTGDRVPEVEVRLVPYASGLRDYYGDALLHWLRHPAEVGGSKESRPPADAAPRLNPRGPISDRTFSPDGRHFAISTEAGIVALFDAGRFDKPTILHGHMQAAFGVTFSPDGRRLVSTGGVQDGAKLWDVKTRQELLTLPAEGSLLYYVEFTDDGNTLLTGPKRSVLGTWQFWRAPSWSMIGELEARGGGWLRSGE